MCVRVSVYEPSDDETGVSLGRERRKWETYYTLLRELPQHTPFLCDETLILATPVTKVNHGDLRLGSGMSEQSPALPIHPPLKWNLAESLKERTSVDMVYFPESLRRMAGQPHTCH